MIKSNILTAVLLVVVVIAALAVYASRSGLAQGLGLIAIAGASKCRQL